MTRRRKGQRKRSRMLCVCVWNSTICNTLPPLILQLKLIYTYTMCLRVVLMFDLLLLLLLKKKRRKNITRKKKKMASIPPHLFFHHISFYIHNAYRKKRKKEDYFVRMVCVPRGQQSDLHMKRNGRNTRRLQQHTHTHTKTQLIRIISRE